MLLWRINLTSLGFVNQGQDQMGFGQAHPYFYLTIWFQRKRCEALLVVTIMRYDFSFHGEVS
jgi:hypothetical protein